MKFKEEDAKELIRRYRLSEKTFQNWEAKGAIPDYLLKESVVRIDEMNLREVRAYLNYKLPIAVIMLRNHGLQITGLSLSLWERGAKPNKNNRKKLVQAYQTLINQKRKLLGL